MFLQRRWLYCLILIVISGPVRAQSLPFSWDQATIYHVVTDRFSNGNSSNDGAYGRGLDGEGAPYTKDVDGHFMGGDFAGIAGWIENGYFADLGVNTLLLSSPFEQVHGWIGGGDGSTQEYGFHGEWALDYTEPDAAFGTKDEFRNLVDTAHENGIRVLIEVHMAGPGPATLHDMTAFDFGHISTPTWRSWRPAGGSNWSTFESHFMSLSAGPNTGGQEEAWARWWGPNWIHANNLPGYTPCPAQQACQGGVSAMFRESAGADTIPEFLRLKWGPEKTAAEIAELDAFFTSTSLPRSARGHVVKWVTDWVREFGLDGFVIQDEDFVTEGNMTGFEQEAARAYDDWQTDHSWSHGIPGFWIVSDDVFTQERGFLSSDSLAAVFGQRLDSESGLKSIVRMSGTDIGLGGRQDHQKAGTRLFLAPGPILIYYGDELAREPGQSSDPALAARSPMDWAAVEPLALEHWKKLAAFRAAHPSVARGENDVLLEDPYAFYRGVQEGGVIDQVVIAVGVEGRLRLNVSPVWPDDTVLRDAYTGKIAIVSFGQVVFESDPAGVVLIEEVVE